jgi:uncharacterized protein YqhQ
VFRVGVFVGYLWLIGRTRDVRRVFEYHGAEHKTIAANEHEAPLEPGQINRFPKEHVRCGTNFLIIVLIVTVFVFALFGTPGLAWRIGSRLLAIPLIAGLAYEALRLGARFPNSHAMRALMRPGIWLQKITTREPNHEQIEVAVASFSEVRRAEHGAAVAGEPTRSRCSRARRAGPPSSSPQHHSVHASSRTYPCGVSLPIEMDFPAAYEVIERQPASS